MMGIGKISVQDASIELSKVEQALLHTITEVLFVKLINKADCGMVLAKAKAIFKWSRQEEPVV